ncbi:ADP-ribosylation factor-binding protein GGA3-like [Synchiropus splendidus]|uniref:ADP-ribosylation factor-binding protein GGA3-like n=1 Tax=Synchiropus splendidus TaxID=270530 RepID=UPI00237E5628|nr:ADP-ribosylation factor-binding protein GGA3-like [Synchiropus splendidus]
MADGSETLESWLNRATNPSNREEDRESIMGFCDKVNKELEGPQISVRLLAHKIQSPQEWEALQALMVLEACMKNCGQRFHIEVGKFRFLNELIKVLSTKYLGDHISEKVKTRVTEMLYSWTLSLPKEEKIRETYHMLKKQGLVSADPKIPHDATQAPSSTPQVKNTVFDDEKKSRKLSELLKSKKPEDLQEANRLIKNMVKEDELRMQKEKKLTSTLEEVNNSVKLLSEMLACFSVEDSTESDTELIKELYDECDKLREKVSQLASETEDNDTKLGEILQASDDLSRVIHLYRRTVEGHSTDEDRKEARSRIKAECKAASQSEILIDLTCLDTPSSIPPKQQPCSSSLPEDLLCVPDPDMPACTEPPAALTLLDEELLSLGINDPLPLHHNLIPLQDSNHNLVPSASNIAACSPFLMDTVTTTTDSSTSVPTVALPCASSPQSVNKVGAVPLAPMVSAFLATSPLTTSSAVAASQEIPALVEPAVLSLADRPLHELAVLDMASPNIRSPGGFGTFLPEKKKPDHPGPLSFGDSPLLVTGSPGGFTSPPTNCNGGDQLMNSLPDFLHLYQASAERKEELSLANVSVPLDAIKPSKVSPVTAYDKNGIRVLLHFAADCPPDRPDVLVMVVSMLNTSPLRVSSMVLQAAVPKTMKVKLQPASGSELAAFNPVLPPATITQVMLLANPHKENVKMRYKLTFTLGEQHLTEVGELNEFPPAQRWGSL